VERERTQLLDHRPNRELRGTRTRARTVAVHEEELIDAVRGGGQEITAEAEQVAVTRIQTRDGPPTHQADLVRDRDARHRRPADVVVGDEERARDATQDADLMTHVLQVGPSRRLDLADDLERALRARVRHVMPTVCIRTGSPDQRALIYRLLRLDWIR